MIIQDKEDKACNSLPNHSDCLRKIAKAKCSGIEAGKCVSRQLHNATKNEIEGAQSAMKSMPAVMTMFSQ